MPAKPVSNHLRIAVRVAVVVALVSAAAIATDWYGSAALARLADLRGAGPSGVLAFVGIYAVGSWLMLPAAWFQGSAGFLYGPLAGPVVAWALSTAAGMVAFELGRGWMRKAITAELAATGRLAAFDRAMARRGLIAVALLRLSPLAPYNIVSYALGATAVPRATFWAGNALGSLSPALIWALVGASVGDLTEISSQSLGNARWAVLATAVIAGGGLAIVVQRALAEES